MISLCKRHPIKTIIIAGTITSMLLGFFAGVILPRLVSNFFQYLIVTIIFWTIIGAAIDIILRILKKKKPPQKP
ncbi:MAG: hypothetical protein ACR2N8_00620 [Parvibaculales bacterium]